MEGHELIKSGAWRPRFGGNGLFTPATMDSDPWIKFESTNFHKYTIALCNDSIFDIVFSLSLKGAEAQGIICSLLKMQQSTAVIAAGSQDSSHGCTAHVDENIKP